MPPRRCSTPQNARDTVGEPVAVESDAEQIHVPPRERHDRTAEDGHDRDAEVLDVAAEAACTIASS